MARVGETIGSFISDLIDNYNESNYEWEQAKKYNKNIENIDRVKSIVWPLAGILDDISYYNYVKPKMYRQETFDWEKELAKKVGIDPRSATFWDEFNTYVEDAQKLGYIDGQKAKDGLAAYTKYRNNSYNLDALSDQEHQQLRDFYDLLWNDGNPKFASFYNRFAEGLKPEDLDNFLNGLGAELNNLNIPAPTFLKDFENYQKEVAPLKWYTNKEIADMLNIDYDFNNIKNELDTAAQAGVDYANWKSDLLANTAERDNNQMLTSYLDAIRNTKSQAIQKGVTNGARAAAEYLATMDTINNKGQTELQVAKDREAAVNDALLERAQTEINALNTYDKLAQMLANGGTTFYANDVERRGADTLANSNFFSADENTRANFLSANARMAAANAYANAANQQNIAQAGEAYNYLKDISLPANDYNIWQALKDYQQLAYQQETRYQSYTDKWGAMSQYGNK